MCLIIPKTTDWDQTLVLEMLTEIINRASIRVSIPRFFTLSDCFLQLEDSPPAVHLIEWSIWYFCINFTF